MPQVPYRIEVWVGVGVSWAGFGEGGMVMKYAEGKRQEGTRHDFRGWLQATQKMTYTKYTRLPRVKREALRAAYEAIHAPAPGARAA
jgi:hypothetical protein